MALSREQAERYCRNIILKQVGPGGQERLLASRVLVVGAGGLGSPAALYLAAAGVGTIGLVDFDRVSLDNLQRQVLHNTGAVGSLKVDSGKKSLLQLNPEIAVRTYPVRAGAGEFPDLAREYDFVLDCTDNFEAKFMLNDACYAAARPLSHAGVLGFIGQMMTIVPGESACYRCVFDQPPPPDAVLTCAQAGVLGVLPGVIGCLQATEAVKFLLGIGELLTDTLLTYDALGMRFRRIPVPRNPQCRLCGKSPVEREE